VIKRAQSQVTQSVRARARMALDYDPPSIVVPHTVARICTNELELHCKAHFLAFLGLCAGSC
jgi:hypothetical protein